MKFLILWTLGLLAALGCRFMPKGGHWIEAHGGGLVSQVTGRADGVIAVGKDNRLWAYPTDYARPWRQQGPQEVRKVAASAVTVYVIASNGELFRISGGQWAPYAGSATWGATAIAASEDDHLFAVVRGKTRLVAVGGLDAIICDGIVATAIAASSARDIYIIDDKGRLHHSNATDCTPLSTPDAIRNVAAHGKKVAAVTTLGSAIRRQADGTWHTLPIALKYRPRTDPEQVTAVEIALSAHSTWLMDSGGSVFLLSDEN